MVRKQYFSTQATQAVQLMPAQRVGAILVMNNVHQCTLVMNNVHVALASCVPYMAIVTTVMICIEASYDLAIRNGLGDLFMHMSVLSTYSIPTINVPSYLSR